MSSTLMHHRIRPAGAAAFCTGIAGIAGALSLVLSWRAALPGGGAWITGWQQFVLRRHQASRLSDFITTYAVLAVGVIGCALILLSVLLLMSTTHNPAGVIGLLLSLASMLGVAWYIFADVGAREAFAGAQPGFYCFVVSGAVGLVGSLIALSTD